MSDEAETATETSYETAGLDGDEIHTLIKRLARPHRSGGWMIERAPLLAAGTSYTDIVRWIEAHGGEAEAVPPPPPGRGLHSGRATKAPVQSTRWLLPASALS